MNRSVPTLLGIVVILVVVVLVVLVYNIMLTNRLATGGTPTGTVGGEILTGEQAPTTEISPSEALAREREKVEPMPEAVRQRAGARRGELIRQREAMIEKRTKEAAAKEEKEPE